MLPNCMEALDFNYLDGFVVSAHRGANTPAEVLLARTPEALGPITEYAFLAASLGLPSLGQIFSGRLVEALQTVLVRNSASPNPSTSLTPTQFEFSRVGTERDDPQRHWHAFIKRLQRAGEASGFPPLIAAGFAGAFREMATNVIEHSERPESAVVGYRATNGEFEYVVADQGDGVLKSLRRHESYAGVVETADALMKVLSGGHSRFGPTSGHGDGFPQVFNSLASLYGHLRFRSGDCAVELNGENPSVLEARPAQRPYYQGLLVSVTCRTK